MARSGQHSSKSDNWGTPPEYVELARAVLGRIDLDPSSSPQWNASIGAWRIITADEDGLRTPWVNGAPSPVDICRQDAPRCSPRRDVRVYLNPPGDKSGELVAAFWRALASYHALGWISCAFYDGFSLEQLSRLQRVGARSHPLCWPTLFPRERVDHLIEPGRPGTAAGHASFFTLLPANREQVATFCALGARYGAVVNGATNPVMF